MRRILLAIVILLATVVAGPSAAWAQAAKSSSAAKARATAANPVNLNSASATQLQTLPGVGAGTAQRIVEYRQKNGSFKKIEDIPETSRSCPYLLTIVRLSVRRPIARNRQKSQQISRRLAGGGRFGGRTWTAGKPPASRY
jgi:competence ComEA-like helix-hairpin-helix protein